MLAISLVLFTNPFLGKVGVKTEKIEFDLKVIKNLFKLKHEIIIVYYILDRELPGFL